MKKKQLRANCMLLLAAFCWGSTFVAQSVGTAYVGPFAFQGVRCLLGAVVLLPVVALSDRLQHHRYHWRDKELLRGGLCCGLVLFVAANLQQTGLQAGTTAGKSGFITALYIVLVPVLSLLVLRRHPSKWVWCGVVLATVGLYLLCITESFSIAKGDLYTLACALCFAVHILVIDHFSPKCDGVRMSCLQFLVCGLLSLIAMPFFETPPTASALLQCWLPIAYAGICSCGIGYTMQILAQRDTNPTVASLLMSLESVFATLSGWLVLHETLHAREYIGCLLMLAAVLLAQLPGKPRTAKASRP